MIDNTEYWFWRDPKTKILHVSLPEHCLDNTPKELLPKFVHSVDETLSRDPYMWRPWRVAALY